MSAGRRPFTFRDLERECAVTFGGHRLDDHGERALGARVSVPPELRARYPYCASAYAFLQELRAAIREYGLIEFPGLPVNPTNHTLAQRAPAEHAYSRNPYLTTHCQKPHQDTPPYPTAFWLGAPRRFSATWVLSRRGAERYMREAAAHPREDDDALHARLVSAFSEAHLGTCVNRSPGLLLMDNSDACGLYHARTRDFDAVREAGTDTPDAPMYAFNEVGLLEHFGALDERRGVTDTCARDRAEVVHFMAREREGRAGATPREP